ncbi:EGF-like domain containing protein [Acrasis kona]|uniref:EGF-like domain containing protein n=1 Tax=Acrasis kona TaxID=1008807 RepID=A0AAW2ZNB2_9EUKA
MKAIFFFALLALFCAAYGTDQTELVFSTFHESNDEAKCRRDDVNRGFMCDIVFQHKILGKKISFNGTVALHFDVPNQQALVEAIVNGKAVYSKFLTLDGVDKVVCVKAIEKIGLEMCTEINHIKWDVKVDCFKADVSITVSILGYKLTVVPPSAVGVHPERC